MTALSTLLAEIGSGHTPWKIACRVVSTSNITLSGLQTVDATALAEGDRVLVAGQTDAKQNGIYLASANTWARARDLGKSNYALPGTAVRVMESGGDNAGWWTMTSPTNGAIRLGVTELQFEILGGFVVPPPAWSPGDDLPGLTDVYDPGRLTAGDGTAIASLAGTYATGPTMAAGGVSPTLDRTNAIDGRPVMDLVATGSGAAIDAATGGVTGALPFSMVVFSKINVPGALGSIVRMGEEVAAFPAGGSAVVGGCSPGAPSVFWAGGSADSGGTYGLHDTDFHIHAYTYSGTRRKVYMDGEQQRDDSLALNITSARFGFGPWSTNTGYNGSGKIAWSAFGTQEWSREKLNELMVWLMQLYPSLRRRPRVIVDGTSIEAGWSATAGNSWPVKLNPLLDPPPTQAGAVLLVGTDLVNLGVAGQNTDAMNSDRQLTVDWRKTPFRSKNIVVQGAGWTNCLHLAGASSATAITRATTYRNAVIAAGHDAFLCTGLPRNDQGGGQAVWDTGMAACNAWARANCPASRLLDFAAIPEAANPANATYYQDGIHPTHALNQILAEYAADKINAAMGWS